MALDSLMGRLISLFENGDPIGDTHSLDLSNISNPELEEGGMYQSTPEFNRRNYHIVSEDADFSGMPRPIPSFEVDSEIEEEPQEPFLSSLTSRILNRDMIFEGLDLFVSIEYDGAHLNSFNSSFSSSADTLEIEVNIVDDVIESGYRWFFGSDYPASPFIILRSE
ncbi:unnamed protein product [Lepeophtheirus salmonis]|uniref:(salmon louse) hypothetical protein n=1 Tax=Lepeophtheirus salmonis TaxID=72036 RepID=A0A7R8H3N5_LEPSM|nr:unnamed protein product [Lepeophtheirus salmonis]CAF2836175.1 unnamed protein product [Lepeophtheirus salmonis]